MKMLHAWKKWINSLVELVAAYHYTTSAMYMLGHGYSLGLYATVTLVTEVVF